ncbi:uncharacterized protein PODANS_1_19740 [Podospora anserina S mat+]|uniref:Podospora anserina S mat+ genomic DNA chromosome 1, supercontig 4 n=1 Tax=Podospora anserina (strain S / ATCC MYA-4624 / DSM 980 / FGSC 10383) TaxID=515849 RepID=B2AUN7_PODAN|nr:uncharacterized protein PODANS_1_19740 [Podospora anserina S mat+]CAP68110.1 unnamed protein product [Podospora anserina S mat+]
MAWSLIHSAWMHYLLAIFNAHDWTMQYVTDFSADIFSLLNSIIYFHKAAMELKRTHEQMPLDSFLYAMIGAVGTCLVAILLSTATKWKPLFGRVIRMGLSEYAAAISIILFVGIPYIGDLADLDHGRLAVQTSFRPTNPEREVFFVRFWELPVEWVFISIIPGAIITILFYFDHEISSIICTVDRYGVKKPGGYAWDIALLGTTTALCGILGIPPANGLLPQAPLHSESLRHWVVDEDQVVPAPEEEEGSGAHTNLVPRVYEQRYSHFLQAAMIMVFVSPPFQRVLGLTPTFGVGGIVHVYGLSVPQCEPYADEILVTVGIFAVTLTVAAPGFPLLIIILVPVRLCVMNRVWGRETLRFVDGWACREGKPEDDEMVGGDEGFVAGGRDVEDGGERSKSQ